MKETGKRIKKKQKSKFKIAVLRILIFIFVIGIGYIGYYKSEKDVFRYYYFVNADNEEEYNNLKVVRYKLSNYFFDLFIKSEYYVNIT